VRIRGSGLRLRLANALRIPWLRPAGAYRGYVGTADSYDLAAASQFNLLTLLGLREQHYLLDVGCGSLRGGRLFIPYLLPGRYYGIEPNRWLVKEGLRKEIGRGMRRLKRPEFSYDDTFTLTAFGHQFDFILAQSIFTHAAAAQIRRCLSESKQVMHAESLFLATFLEGDENYAGSDWSYPEGVYYTRPFMLGLVSEAGLIARPLSWKHNSGHTWIVIARPDAAARLHTIDQLLRGHLLDHIRSPG
jgi:SAM-dependent methyltransferase